MKPKKYEKHNINTDRGIYFALGLSIVLGLTYVALEWKTYDQVQEWDSNLMVESELVEEVPVTVHELKFPNPKIIAPPIIEIVPDDEEDLIESIIESSESDSETEILKVEDIVVEHVPEDEEIPFIAIEEVPLFPGCESAEDKRSCFQRMIHKHVEKNFRYPELAIETGLEGKVYVMFVIEKDGSIGEIRLRSPHDILGTEAQRIISELPRMTPGKQRGRAVKVSFSLPLVFKLQ